MAIIITNSFAVTATDDHINNSQPGRCVIANYFVRSNAIDYTVAINNQRIGNGDSLLESAFLSVARIEHTRSCAENPKLDAAASATIISNSG